MAEMRWTAQQAAAIVTGDDRLLVANAGTGKTTTVVGKIRWLIGEDVGVEEDSGRPIPRCSNPCRLDEIAAITFTEKAAYDLKRKLREELARSPRAAELLWQIERATLGTIHSFCGDLLRENALRMGIDPTFSVLDEEEARVQQELMIRDIILERLGADDMEAADLVRTHRLTGYEFTNGTCDLVRTAFRDLRWHGERYRAWIVNSELDAATLARVFGSALDPRDTTAVTRCQGLYRMAALMLDRWAAHERTENVRDFDSLILDARALLTGAQSTAALAAIRRRYRILIIDEFQDTDGAQRDIAYAIGRGVERPQLLFVGDPKQSIYRFRGADISVWNAVANDVSMLPLSRNFRSEPAIVDLVNAVSSPLIDGYTNLQPSREARVGGAEWIVPADGNEAVRRASEGANLGARIRELVENGTIIDSETRQPRKCAYRDIAVLYRVRTGLAPYKRALREWAVPFVEHSPAGLAERQEIHDLLNLLRLIDNPANDLCAFAFLRSPFVGLRDEVLVRMRLDMKYGDYLQQAKRYLDVGDWFAAPEHAAIVDVERAALRRGRELFWRARKLANRLPIDELLSFVFRESGYRDHLMLLDGSREALANINAFLHLLGGHRNQTIGRFLELWDSRDPADPGLPQGQIYSSSDDVVTLSTIHAAKGLEWPVVFLVDVSSELRDQSTNDYWHDPQLGPLLCPKKDERGPRADLICQHNRQQEQAEQARLVYVSTTRARDRLIVLGDHGARNSQAAWLANALKLFELKNELDPAPPARAPRLIELAWLDRPEPVLITQTIPTPPHRFMTSATELMTRERDAKLWEMLYIHGVEPVWQFAPRGRSKDLPERIRGDVIHGVLERITPDALIAELLEETIGELDAPELEIVLAAGTEQRLALENEIARVVGGEEWKWYVAGEHYRELPFLYLAGPRDWLVGAFDLYRPDGWIIDFKTHQIVAEMVEKTASSYRLQMDIYRRAAGIAGPVRTQLHFTHPGVVIELAAE